MSRKVNPGMTPVLFSKLYMESWKAGHTVRQFADRTGMTVHQVHSRLRYYRKRGCPLPDLKRASVRPPRRKPIPVREMCSIVDAAMQFKGQVDDEVRPARTNGRL